MTKKESVFLTKVLKRCLENKTFARKLLKTVFLLGESTPVTTNPKPGLYDMAAGFFNKTSGLLYPAYMTTAAVFGLRSLWKQYKQEKEIERQMRLARKRQRMANQQNVQQAAQNQEADQQAEYYY